MSPRISPSARAILGGLALLGSGVGCRHPTGPESSVAGLYVLVELDGVVFPAAKPSFLTCPGPISQGELFLYPGNSETATIYYFSATVARPCDLDDSRLPNYREVVLQFARDGGSWSTEGGRIRFRSSPSEYRNGQYEGEIRQMGGEGNRRPALIVTFDGHTYMWRRVRPAGGPSEVYTPVIAVDQQEKPVNGTGLEFRYVDGIVNRGTINNDRPGLIVGPSGLGVTIHINPPAGYTFAPGQSAQVTAVAGQPDRVVIRLIRTSP